MEEQETGLFDIDIYDDFTCHVCGLDPCDCYDDVCCYDPRYTGAKGTCLCADQQKEWERENHWFFKYWDFCYYVVWRNFKYKWIQHPVWSAKKYLFHKTTCTECKVESLDRKWKGVECPNCGKDCLPF